MAKNTISSDVEAAVRGIVRAHVNLYAEKFERRHINEIGDPKGTINMKAHNVFIADLGAEIKFYSAISRSFDSSFGNMLEHMAANIAMMSYKVSRRVEGPIHQKQTQLIAELLESYSFRVRNPQSSDYAALREKSSESGTTKSHKSDLCLFDEATNEYSLIELKTGGDLDSKGGRSEKESILEQFAMLSNTLPPDTNIKVYFATAYNHFGEDQPWKQGRVRRFFAGDELLIGKDFWNFICKSDLGFETVMDEYKKRSEAILRSLERIKKAYLER